MHNAKQGLTPQPLYSNNYYFSSAPLSIPSVPNFLIYQSGSIMAPQGSHTSTTTRAAVVTLKAVGKQTSATISWLTGLSVNQVNRIYARAISRGFDPNYRPFTLKDEWLEDAPRSGRPSKQTDSTTESVVTEVRKDRYGCKKTAANIASKHKTKASLYQLLQP
jgi:hypothetical protein